MSSKDLLVTVVSTFRRNGGGDMAWVGEAPLLAAPSAILTVRVIENVVKEFMGKFRRVLVDSIRFRCELQLNLRYVLDAPRRGRNHEVTCS